MEFRDQPDSPDPPPTGENDQPDAQSINHNSSNNIPPESSQTTLLPESSQTTPPVHTTDSDGRVPVDQTPQDDLPSSLSSAAATTVAPSPAAAATTTSSPTTLAIQPDFLASLAGTELTPAVTALLKQMMDEKNRQEEEKARREGLLGQIKALMDWPNMDDAVRAFFPEDYMGALVSWILGSMQPEVIRQAIVDQNRKELEYHKKREKMVHDQHREITVLRKKHQEALHDCDTKNTPHRKPIVTKSNDEEMQRVLLKQEEELYSLDRKIVQAIDHLLTAQQKKFQDLGLPGMKETMVSQDIQQQMIVIDVVARLAGVDGQAK
ncbi:hypothetical protein BV898_03903 [Hypsibius exemplaris]|uniref:Uncharacterized protein n=1 Tax=Hypsibius exemplaris TaxID=2072580 RepID=A0A1W0X3I9_HYPEX|nr:hypothetical protein BV898_03903 [Hypsibius exemplaris]